jgi:hypothetical protein
MRFTVRVAIIFLVFAASVFSQNDTCSITVRAQVVDIPETSFDIEEPPAHAVVIVTYRISKVLRGVYNEGSMKVAQGVGTLQKLSLGDEVTMTVKRDGGLRESAKILKEMGIENRSDESISDYILIEFGDQVQRSKPRLRTCKSMPRAQ